jgi:transposase-like protein
MPEQEQILKIDTRGRVRYSAERRAAILKEFSNSGLSAHKFAAVTGVNYQTLAGWIARARRTTGGDSSAPVQWLEAVVNQPAAVAGRSVLIHLSGKVSAELAHETQIELLVKLIRGLQAC